MTDQRTISFGKELLDQLILDHEKFIAKTDVNVSFSEFVCSKIRLQMKNDITIHHKNNR